MAGSGRARQTARAASRRRLAVAAGTVSVALLSLAIVPASASETALSEADQACLACHASDALKKQFSDGSALSLQVRPEGFARSVHAPFGCVACHTDVKPQAHPGGEREIKSARAYSLAMVAACRGCHSEEARLQEGSHHAALLRQGNPWGPVCTDCHGSHEVTPRTAFDTCVACHTSAMLKHGQWLPNAGLHLETVSCAACHAPGAKRMVELRLFDNDAGTWAVEPEGGHEFATATRSADADGNGLDAAELRQFLAQLAPKGAPRPRVLRGRVELNLAVESHLLADRTRAIKECANCHRRGAEPFENVTVSIVSASGKALRYAAHKDVLNSALSVETLREFYAVGGTRSVVLDALLVLAVAGGVAVPLGHQALKWFVKKRLRMAPEGGRGQTPGQGRPAPSDEDGNRE